MPEGPSNNERWAGCGDSRAHEPEKYRIHSFADRSISSSVSRRRKIGPLQSSLQDRRRWFDLVDEPAASRGQMIDSVQVRPRGDGKSGGERKSLQEYRRPGVRRRCEARSGRGGAPCFRCCSRLR